MKKICVIATSRATYGYKRKIIQLIKKDKFLKLQVIVTGMHLMKKYGYSISELKKDKVPISEKIKIFSNMDSNIHFVKGLSKEMSKLSNSFSKLKPDLVLVTGDRAEMFIAAVTAVYMNIPVAHIQAGDLSGHIDGSVRHAITKISHIHFASCKDSAERVKKMGEQNWRVFNVGAPQLDDLIDLRKNTKINKKINKLLSQKYFLIIQHPVLIEKDETYKNFRNTLTATESFKNYKKIIIYPNVDSGNRKIIQLIKNYKKKKNFTIFKNIERENFKRILKNSKLILGNSSCGILEAPSFKVPAINIGNRQRDRMQAINVINTDYKVKNIRKALNYALINKSFKLKLKNCKNPYGTGKSSEKIIRLIKKTIISKRLLDKRMIY